MNRSEKIIKSEAITIPCFHELQIKTFEVENQPNAYVWTFDDDRLHPCLKLTKKEIHNILSNGIPVNYQEIHIDLTVSTDSNIPLSDNKLATTYDLEIIVDERNLLIDTGLEGTVGSISYDEKDMSVNLIFDGECNSYETVKEQLIHLFQG